MQSRCATTRHSMGLDSEWKFRCDPDLPERFDRIASILRRNKSDLSRLVFEDYVARMERELGLTHYAIREPGTSSTPAENALNQVISGSASHARRATIAPPPPASSAKYPAPRRSKTRPK